MKNKLFFAFLLLSVGIYGQDADLLKTKYAFSYTKKNYFAFYDATRLAGGGIGWRFNRLIGIDAGGGVIYPNGPFFSQFYPGDYNVSVGGFVFVMPKLFINPTKSFFVGLMSTLNYYGYRNKWVLPEAEALGLDAWYLQLRDKRTFSNTLGLAFGFVRSFGKVYAEFFLAPGFELARNKTVVYEDIGSGLATHSPPVKHTFASLDLNIITGIKIGFGKGTADLYTRKYYEQKFLNLTEEDFVSVKKASKAKQIERKQFVKLTKTRQELLVKLLKEYKRKVENNDSMKQELEKGASEFKEEAKRLLSEVK